MALDNLTPDKYQQIIINMSADRTAVVKGIAGSGKSLTLLKKAKQVSTFTSSYQGRRTKIIRIKTATFPIVKH